MLVGGHVKAGIRLPRVQVHRADLAPAVAAVPGNAPRGVGHFADDEADALDRLAVVGHGLDGAPAALAVHEDTGVPVLVRLRAVVDPGLGALTPRAVLVVGGE